MLRLTLGGDWLGAFLGGLGGVGLLIVFLLRNKKAKTLIISGVVFLVIGSLLTVMTGYFMAQLKSVAEEADRMLAEGQEVPAELLEMKELAD